MYFQKLAGMLALFAISAHALALPLTATAAVDPWTDAWRQGAVEDEEEA
ncbi:hypothetical protein SUNI508_13392 [Seiridium unicorne]|uniref:Uncharacterized protein n=1 Tax=Seiridium unicorne TaxID=138068 RepID=A0ABR2VD62_9PEZI